MTKLVRGDELGSSGRRLQFGIDVLECCEPDNTGDHADAVEGIDPDLVALAADHPSGGELDGLVSASRVLSFAVAAAADVADGAPLREAADPR